MASLFTAFGGSAMAKQLLRYALSRIELLDTDALDMENLDFALGRHSVVEFRDVGIRLQKLEHLLQLPATFRLLRAKVLLLRITIPVDFYSSPILVEVDGVDLRLKVLSLEDIADLRKSRAKRRTNSDVIPTTVDLAQSFLEQQPASETRELEAALAETQDLGASLVASEDGSDEDSVYGTGEPLSLPTFLASFLQGIVDRLQVQIRGVTLQLDIEVSVDPNAAPELVTFQLALGNINVEGVTSTAGAAEGSARIVPKEDKRHITLENVTAFLISEANVFSTFARSPSAPPSVSPQSSSVAPRSPLSSRSAASSQRIDEEDVMEYALQASEDVFDIPYDLSSSSEEADDEDAEPPASSLSTPRASVYHDLALRPHPPLSQSAIMDAGEPLEAALDREAQSAPTLPEALRVEDISASRSPAASMHSEPASDGSDFADDLTQSHLYTHEYAESMYESAYSQTESVRMRNRMPGSWDEPGPSSPESSSSKSAKSSLTNLQPHVPGDSPNTKPSAETRTASLAPAQTPEASPGPAVGESLEAAASEPPPPQAEPPLSSVEEHDKPTGGRRGASFSGPELADSSAAAPEECATPRGPTRLVKRLLSLGHISVYVPSTHKRIDVATPDGGPGAGLSTSPRPPGAFSMRASSPPTPSPPNPLGTSPDSDNPPGADAAPDKAIEVILSPVEIQFDASIGFLLAMVVSRLLAALEGQDEVTAGKRAAPSSTAGKESSMPDVRITAEALSLLFLEQLSGVADTPTRPFSAGPADFNSDILLQTHLRDLQISVSQNETAIDVGGFTFGYAGEEGSIVSFDHTAQMAASVKDAIPAHGAEISVKIHKTTHATQCNVLTLPLLVRLDLRRLDETFSWFGGLSGFLSLGSSMTSNTAGPVAGPAARAQSKKPSEKPRGVRFDTPIKPEDRSVSSENKINVRVGAIRLDLIGKDCDVVLETSALKLVSRDEGLGVTLSKIRLHGPYVAGGGHHPPISLVVVGTRVEYLATPKDNDLERLLELITPSKLKFDADKDEIIVETLLRQRRKGPVLRVGLDKVAVDVSDIPMLSCLPSLGEDLARLGTVAKYLPEDDRPGLLTLALVRDLDVSVDVGGRFGVVNASAKNFDTAHITVPSLVALAVGQITVNRNKIEELVGSSILPPATREQAPVLMLRMIGDVTEPTITVKMRGLNFEYRVPTIMDLLDLAEDVTPEDFEAGLAASVAHLGGQAQMAMAGNPADPNPSRSGVSGGKPPKVELFLLDCLLGLNPLGMTSKMGVAFVDANLEINVADQSDVKVEAHVQEATVLLIDDVSAVDWERAPSVPQHRHRPSDPHPRQRKWTMETSLCARGFVAVCHIHSAVAKAHVATDGDGDRLIDVELEKSVVVLQTCADSTQTMISLPNGLKPPTPPSKEVKFKTQIIPVEDLLASIAPDAFGRAEGNYNFDDDFGAAVDQLQGRGIDMDDEDGDEDEREYDFGIYHRRDSQTYASQSHYFHPSTVEEELFNATSSSSSFSDRTTTHSMHYGGVLLGDFGTTNAGCGLGGRAPEYLTGGVKARHRFGPSRAIGGLSNQWNSARNTFEPADPSRKSPIKVRARGLHLFWKLFDGYDWQRTRDVLTEAVREVEAKAHERRARSDRLSTYDQDYEVEDGTVIGDFLFNSIYIGIPANNDPQELSQAIAQELYNGADTESMSAATTTTAATATPGRRHQPGKKLRLGRSRHHKIQFELTGVDADLTTYPRGSGETESSVNLRVRDLEVIDLVPTSTWRKFATYNKDAGERGENFDMLHLELFNVRPVADAAATEMVICVGVMPLRLHVDQDALDFITRFFEFKDDSAPVAGSPSDIPFIQRFDIDAVPVVLDFKPKRVDYAGLRSGHTTEFMNFLILEGSEMVMKRAILYGITGFERLGKSLNDIWMPNIKRTQLPGVLAGLAPIRSLVNVGSGFKDLVVVPIHEYKRDGRIMRSLGKGAAAFARTTGTELVKLGAKVAIGTQYVLQGVEGMLGDNPDQTAMEHQQHGGISGGWDDDDDSAEDPAPEQRQISLYANQPTGVVQGLRHAYAGINRDLAMARNAVVAVSAEVMESQGAAGAAAAVARRAPTIIFRPMIGLTKAAGQTLLGATNSLDPKNIRRMEDKYKSGPGR